MAEEPSGSIRISADDRKKLGTEIRDRITKARQDRQEYDLKLDAWREQYEAVVKPKDFPWPACSNISVPLTTWQVDRIRARIRRAVFQRPIWMVQATVNDIDPEVLTRLEGLFDYQARAELKLLYLSKPLLDSSLVDGVAYLKVTQGREIQRRMRWTQNRDMMTGETTETAQLEDRPRDWIRGEIVELTDLHVFPANATIETATGIAQRIWLTPETLRERARQGIYSNVEDSVKEATEVPLTKSDDIELIRNSVGEDRVQIAECIWRLPIVDSATGSRYTEDGIMQDCLVTLAYNSGVILRLELYPYWHGRRCFVPFTPYRRRNRMLGSSLAGRLQDIQEALNTRYNQSFDAVTVNIMPPRLYRRFSAFNPNAHKTFPGAYLPVDEPDDVTTLGVQPIDPAAFVSESVLRDYAERLTGITDTHNAMSEGSGRTATSIVQSTQEANINFEEIIVEMALALEETAVQVQGLDYQYASDPKLFRFLSDQTNPQGMVSREELGDEYSFELRGNSGMSNRALEQQNAMFVYQMLLQNPLVTMAGDPNRLWEITADVLRAMGRTQIERYIGHKQNAQEIQQAMAMQQFQQLTGGKGLAEMGAGGNGQNLSPETTGGQTENQPQSPIGQLGGLEQ